MIDVVPNAGVIALGKQGENQAVRVTLPNIRAGSGSILLLHQRAADQQPYPVPVMEADGGIIWTVSSTDTAYPGRGQAELQWLGADGAVIKSVIYQTNIIRALTSPGAVPDEPLKPYTQAVAKDAQAAKDAAANATEAARSAEASAGQAGLSAATATEAAKNAEAIVGQAGQSAQSAQAAALAAAQNAAAAETAEAGANQAKTEAEAAKTEAQTAQAAAEEAAQEAKTAQSGAVEAKMAAETAQARAEEAAQGVAADREQIGANTAGLEAARRAIQFQAEINKGQTWDFEEDTQEAYQRQVPSGAKAGAVMEWGGKTVAAAHPEYNAGELLSALVDEVRVAGKNVARPISAFSKSGVTMIVDKDGVYHFTGTATTIAGVTSEKFTLPGGTYTVSVKSALPASVYISISSITALMVGPNTVKTGNFKGGSAYVYLYIGKGVIMDNVSIAFQVERGATNTVYVPYQQTTTYPIPSAVQALPGYGWSAGSVANTVERTDNGWQYVQRVGSRAYQDGDELTDGTTTYYALATPITTDITDLMGNSLAPFAVEAGGSITMHHPEADDGFAIDVPAKIQYITKLSEVRVNG